MSEEQALREAALSVGPASPQISTPPPPVANPAVAASRAGADPAATASAERLGSISRPVWPTLEALRAFQHSTAPPGAAAPADWARSGENASANWTQQPDAQAYLAQQQQQQQFLAQYQQRMLDEQNRLDQTVDLMFTQTRWASAMFAATFGLGVFLILISVGIVIARPNTSNPLVALFFGVGALSMLAFFLRDPAEKIQKAGGNLVQLQIAFRLSNYEWQYWGAFFNGLLFKQRDISASDINAAMDSARQTTLDLMRQIDLSLGDGARKSAARVTPAKAGKGAENPSPA